MDEQVRMCYSVIFHEVRVPPELPRGDATEQYKSAVYHSRAQNLFQGSLRIGNVAGARAVASAANWSQDAIVDELWRWYQQSK